MPILESTNFSFNGITSQSMGLTNVNFQNGLVEEVFIANRSIVEAPIRGKINPYFQEIKTDPLQFELNFAFNDAFTVATGVLTFSNTASLGDTVTIKDEIYEFCSSSSSNIAVVVGATPLLNSCIVELAEAINQNSRVVSAVYDLTSKTVTVRLILSGVDGSTISTTTNCGNVTWSDITLIGNLISLRDVAKWLTTDYYKPLIFADNPTKVYYAMFIDTAKLNYLSDRGFISLTCRCNGPYCYGTLITSEVITDNLFSITNTGDVDTYPIIITTSLVGGTFSITNLTDDDNTLTMADIANEEILTIDNETSDITTSAAMTYRYEKMSGEFIKLVPGVNNFSITGSISIQFIYEPIYLA